MGLNERHCSKLSFTLNGSLSYRFGRSEESTEEVLQYLAQRKAVITIHSPCLRTYIMGVWYPFHRICFTPSLPENGSLTSADVCLMNTLSVSCRHQKRIKNFICTKKYKEAFSLFCNILLCHILWEENLSKLS